MPAFDPIAEGIAVIGLAGRFPGAPDVPSFWRNLVAGYDGITRFTDEELAAAGYDPAALRSDPSFVPARGVIDRPEWFDAAFFGIQPKEAEAIDPQMRVFMELAWHALEDAGCDPARYAGLIGVYAGMSNNTYLRFVRARRDLVEAVGELAVTLGNEKDYLATRLAYKLNLRGPALNINTACSTSLVALATACQSLSSYQCDAVLTGGVSISFPQTRGYFFREGGMTSPDGACRPFDAKAAGAVFSHGCGVVVLKRLADALAEGDQIYAVVKGWALNNDGAGKVSITAPSANGQAEVIALAQGLAGVSPESIGYLEAHGTGTSLGDAIEVEALTQAFGGDSARRRSCALGSLKSNIGHLDAASGVASFIKTALALRHAKIPATLHFMRANPELNLEDSPFHVPAKTIPWPRGAEPRRAGVSSFGVGGTNAHVVLEEGPVQPATTSGRPAQLLTLSARTASALEQAGRDLAAHFEANPEQSFADAAFTLQTGRQQFNERRCIVAASLEEAISALRAEAKLTRTDDRHDTPVTFLFPGQGSQYPRMGAQLYASEPAFRAAFDTVADLLQPDLGLDLRAAIFSGHAEELRQTCVTQPALFAIEYALAQMWLSFGLRPHALLGHSVGEYVAATLAGVFPVEDAARLVAARARLVHALPGGAMLAVRLGEAEAREFVSEQVSIAAINSSRLCVLSGPMGAIAALEAELAARNTPARRLATSHAFHSAMVEPVVAPLTDLVSSVRLRAPQIPFVSNVTGDWITGAQATDPAYWAGHVRTPVRFADGLGKLLEASASAVLEVGPGNALIQLARQHPGRTAAHEFAHTLAEGSNEAPALATAQGRLWLAGVPLDWAGMHAGEIRRRVSLPGYPFERQRYFADLPEGVPMPLTATAPDGEPMTALATSSSLKTAPRSETRPAMADKATAGGTGPSAVARLASLIKEQSGIDLSNADPKTTLLDLGFDSLFLAQLISLIQKRFGIKIHLLDLFTELDSLGALAAHLEKQMGTPAGSPSPSPEPAKTVSPRAIPTTESQRELWLACQRGPLASAAFNETCTIQFYGAFNVEAMRSAIQQVMERHDTLRTIFSADGETQTALREMVIDIPVEDLYSKPAPERAARLLALQSAEGTRNFDLARGPLVAAQIVRLAGESHALIFTAHHLACDGWSFDIVLRELGLIYTAWCEGRPHDLPAPMQMTAYQQWEAEQQRTESFAADRAYWLERFKTLPPPLELPGDHPRPPQRSHAGSREHTIVPHELHREIAQAGAKLGATPFAMLLAAFKTLLFRLSGEHDFVVGVPAAGQNLAGGVDLVGHCVNLLALRSNVEGTETFADFLRTTRTALFEAFDHQRFSFGQLLRHLPLPRDPGRVPLIATTFNLNPPQNDFRCDGLRHEIALNPRAAYQFDLSFNCYEQEGGLRVDCDFNTDLFDPATIQRWLGHYRTLLAAIVAAPQTPLSKLPLMTADERAAFLPAAPRREAISATIHDLLIREWSCNPRPFPREKSLAHLFEQQVERAPNAVALESEKEPITYDQLNQRANRFAQKLRSEGVQRGDFVAIALPRSVDFVVSILAVIKCGAAYVPIDPAYPAARQELMLRDCGAKILVSNEAGPKRAPKTLKIASGQTSSSSNTNPRVEYSDGDLAYVIYTSGSTGTPKGVCIPQSGVTRLVINTDYLQLTPADTVLHVSNICFDAATFEIWGALLNGARLRIVSREKLLSPNGLASTLGEATVAFLTTALFNQIAQDSPEAFGHLRCLLFGGESCDPRAVERVIGRPRELLHVYGPTEATTFATWHRIERVAPQARTIPIGRPIANTEVYLLDEARQAVPAGVAGEIYLGGPGLARGYLHAEELTRSRFVTHPFKANERLYKTGDLARYLSNGALEFIGRSDEQVKIRGHRIEPAEIEQTLRTHHAVRECLVLVQGAGNDKRLAAWAIAPNTTAESLRQHLADRLPSYALPTSISLLEKFPLTANGKIDRAALPNLVGGREDAEALVEPRDPLEVQLVRIWEEVLGRSPIGVRDNFFDLGGHSLRAVRVFSKIEKTLGKDLPLATLFRAPTIEQLATVLRAGESPHVWRSLVPIRPHGSKPPFFCVHGGDGGVVFYQTLAETLNLDHPFYGLQAQGLDGGPVSHTTMERIAAFYIEEMRSVQPHGPYYFGGFSFGGVAAYEIAQQLQAQGEEVGLVALFDAMNPLRPGRRYRLDERIRHRRSAMLRLSLPRQAAYLFGRFWGKILANLWKERERMMKITRKLFFRSKERVPTEYRNVFVRDVHLRAYVGYRPQPYHGKIVLFRASSPNDGYEWTEQLGWEGLIDELEIVHVPGAHGTMLNEPHVHTLASELEKRLEIAHSAGSDAA